MTTRTATRDHVDSGKLAGEKRFESSVAIEDGTVASAGHVRNESREHDFVTNPLFTPKQQTSGWQLFAHPGRFRIGPLWGVVICRLPTPFKVSPACREVSLKQLGQSLTETGFSVIWPEHQSLPFFR